MIKDIFAGFRPICWVDAGSKAAGKDSSTIGNHPFGRVETKDADAGVFFHSKVYEGFCHSSDIIVIIRPGPDGLKIKIKQFNH